MRRLRRAVVVVAVAALAAAALERLAVPAVAQEAGAPPQRPGNPPPGQAPRSPSLEAPPMRVPAATDSFAAERDSMMNAVLRDLAGRENAPAESVFKNIKVMKGMPAGRLVRVMNMGFGRSLGVGCLHCHTREGWDDEGRKQKQVARDMMAMTRRITDELLPAVRNLESDKPAVNCTTCHRGQKKPALDLAR